MLNRGFYLLLLSLSFSVCVTSLNAQHASDTPFQITDKYYALIIAVNNYTDKNIDRLNYPISDASKLRSVLVNHYRFEESNVSMLTDPTRQEIFDAFENISRKTGPRDNLLIFYAGHGEWSNNVGFWWPSDTREKSVSQKISNYDLQNLLNQLLCRHVLLIVDACYGGAVFKTRGPSYISNQALQKMYENTSRKALTSGNMENVPDQGLFANALIKQLKKNTSEFLHAEKLFHEVKGDIINQNINRQIHIPEYGPIAGVEDEGGEFIFARRNGSKPDAPDEAPPVTPKYISKTQVKAQNISSATVSVKKGDKIAISASGMVKVGQSIGYVPPEGKLSMVVLGWPVPISTAYNLNPQWPHGALIYRTSADPENGWKLCGGNCEFISPITGDLKIYFQLNDIQQQDNSGSFAVEIAVIK